MLQHLQTLELTHVHTVLQATPVRVVAVSSEVPKNAGFDGNDLHFKRGPYNSIAAYHQSKLCNVLFVEELASWYGILLYQLCLMLYALYACAHDYRSLWSKAAVLYVLVMCTVMDMISSTNYSSPVITRQQFCPVHLCHPCRHWRCQAFAQLQINL